MNRPRVVDLPLDTVTADRAARVRSAVAVSVPDAHLAAALEATNGPHAVVTSDTEYARRIAGHVGIAVTVVPV